MNFELLNNLIKEYILIVEALKKNFANEIIYKDDKLLLDKEIFEKMLSKKDFLSVNEKKKLWRDLRWISCDKDRLRYTKKVYIDGVFYRKVAIELLPYLTIKELIF